MASSPVLPEGDHRKRLALAHQIRKDCVRDKHGGAMMAMATDSKMNTKKPNSHLTSGRLLARNTMWNLVGLALPVVVGLVTVPLIIRGMGVERFGVLSLAWVVVGYFSLFDLGIGRALTKLIADKLGANEEQSIVPLAWTSLILMGGLGVIGGAISFLVSPLLVYRFLRVPQALQGETLHAFYLLAVSIPIVTLTAGFRGILEAMQQFRVVNLIRIPMSILSFASPLLVLPFSRSLVPTIAVLVALRLLGCLAHVWVCLRVMPARFGQGSFDGSFVIPLIRFGSWMTVNNVVGPLMFYVDRFVVGALLSVSAIAYYTTPVDMVLRITVIPSALIGVLFPAFALSLRQDPERSATLLARGLKYAFMIVFPIALVIVAFAPEGLRFWLGPTFSAQGASVLRWAAAGVFVNSLSTIPFGLIQSAGRPDVTAWMLAIELPLYGVVLYIFTRWWGIEGTAIAWTLRLVIEAVVVLLLADRLLPRVTRLVPKQFAAVAIGLLALYLVSLPLELGPRAALLGFVLLVSGFVVWQWGLTPKERDFVALRQAGAPIRIDTN